MKRVLFVCSLATVFAVVFAQNIAAQFGLPIINDAVINYTAGTLTIQGGNFGLSPTVTLGTTALTLQSATSSQIVATFPAASPVAGFTPGDYLLKVQFANGLFSVFDVTLGAVGPRGPVGITNRGAWDIAASYAANDAVTDRGSFWLAIAPSQGLEPGLVPRDGGPVWQLLAAAGAPGPQGPGGPAGVNGDSIQIVAPPGTAECPTGGQAFQIVDPMGNPILGSRRIVCNGAQGPAGPAGRGFGGTQEFVNSNPLAQSVYFWTAPANVTNVLVEMWGGGGGGGAINITPPFETGGGGGAYSRSVIPVTPGTTYIVTVGGGGFFSLDNLKNGTESSIKTMDGAKLIFAGGGFSGGNIGGNCPDVSGCGGDPDPSAQVSRGGNQASGPTGGSAAAASSPGPDGGKTGRGGDLEQAGYPGYVLLTW